MTHHSSRTQASVVLAALATVAFTATGCANDALDDAGLQVGVEDASARVLPGDRVRPDSLDVLTPSDRESLAFMREEEKLARDVYRTLYQVHGLQIHANIAESEERHTQAVSDLLVRYDLPDPVVDDSVGVFVNPDLDALYDELVAWGSESPVDALLVGATIEDLDMVDLAEAMDETLNPRIDAVYSSLLCGSENHLRGFVGSLEQLDVEYEATFMDPDLMEAILEGEHSSCG